MTYGMRPEDLVFWLDALGDVGHDDVGVLCRRHADSMVVPRGWTLDDLRDPDLHLFRPPERAPVRPRPRRETARPVGAEQLALGVDGDRSADGIDAAGHAAADTITPDESDATSTEVVAASAAADDSDPTDAWTPAFDEGDDLDGLLAARSPLLARAFRGTDRPST